MTNIEIVQNDLGIPVIDSRRVAEHLGVNHRAWVNNVLRKYLDRLEKRFGKVIIKNERNESGRLINVYLLNEVQCTYLLTISQNSDRVLELKANLVEAFHTAKELLSLTLLKTTVLLPENIILPNACEWNKTYSDAWYLAMCRLLDVYWSGKGNKPVVFGTFINSQVYPRIAPDMLSHLRKARGTGETFLHQNLNNDGYKALKELLDFQYHLARSVKYDWEKWLPLLNEAFPKYGHTLQLPFPIDM